MGMTITYFLGIVLRILTIPILLFFLLKIIRKKDTVLMRFIIVSLSTIGYIWNMPFPRDNLAVLFYKLILVVIAWNLITSIFTFRLKLKPFFISLLYSIILIYPIFVITIISFSILGIANKYDVVIMKIAFCVSFVISPILVYSQNKCKSPIVDTPA